FSAGKILGHGSGTGVAGSEPARHRSEFVRRFLPTSEGRGRGHAQCRLFSHAPSGAHRTGRAQRRDSVAAKPLRAEDGAGIRRDPARGGRGAGRVIRQLRSAPNQLTLLRLIFIPFVVISVVEDRYGWALALFVLAGLSDALDGLLARVLKQKTALGQYLDPIADKLLLSTLF